MRDYRFKRDSDHKGRSSKRKMILQHTSRHVCLVCGGTVKRHEEICQSCMKSERK